jgi:hypothetical protein
MHSSLSTGLAIYVNHIFVVSALVLFWLFKDLGVRCWNWLQAINASYLFPYTCTWEKSWPFQKLLHSRDVLMNRVICFNVWESSCACDGVHQALSANHWRLPYQIYGVPTQLDYSWAFLSQSFCHKQTRLRPEDLMIYFIIYITHFSFLTSVVIYSRNGWFKRSFQETQYLLWTSRGSVSGR